MLESPPKELTFKQWTLLRAYKCVIIQYVLNSITPHLYAYSSVVSYSCLQSLQEVTLFGLKCARQFWQSEPYGPDLEPFKH
jgi:hypothetical protein